MSDLEKGLGAIALGWWRANIGMRDQPAARALSARLRRATLAAILCEPKVHEVAQDLRMGRADAGRLARLVSLLAEVREHEGTPLARRLGGTEPVLSPLRFQRLMRAEGEELTAQLRRAIVMAERQCNVAALAEDLLHWNEGTRTRWCFHYFGANAPDEKDDSEEKSQ